MRRENLPASRAAIAALIPHQGSMCLLDAVTECSSTHIICMSTTHRAPDHPLRRAGRLAAVHLCEYGAQAMALHGALTAGTPPRQPGWLVALRDVEIATVHVDDASPLTVSARCLQAGSGGLSYEFSVHGAQLLATGRATVSFRRAE